MPAFKNRMSVVFCGLIAVGSVCLFTYLNVLTADVMDGIPVVVGIIPVYFVAFFALDVLDHVLANISETAVGEVGVVYFCCSGISNSASCRLSGHFTT